MEECHFQTVAKEEEFKRRWDESRAPYERINVLLLSWKECCDNSHTWEEVDRLEHIFKTRFHYGTQREYLCRHASTNVQTGLNLIVSGFAGLHQGPKTLFIAYFAGHAIPANCTREMLMHSGMSSTTKDQVRISSIEMLLKAAEMDSLFIFDCWHAGHAVLPALENPTETAHKMETMICWPTGHAVLPAMVNPTETAQKTETMIREFQRLGVYGSGELNALTGKRSFTTVLTCALVHLLERMPEGRFTTSKLLSEITDCEDFDIAKHPSLIDWITLSGMGRIVFHPLPKDQIASIPSETKAKLGLKVTFHNMPSIADMGTLSKLLNDRLAETELGITGIDFEGLRAAAPCQDSPSTPQETNGHASNGSKADDVIDDDVVVDTKPSTPRLSNEQQ